jgi:hypothetical protein
MKDRTMNIRQIDGTGIAETLSLDLDSPAPNAGFTPAPDRR